MKEPPTSRPADASPAEPNADPPQYPNLKVKTLGGRQLWGDVQFFHGWRIQQQVYTRHYRLLDANDVRHAWGTLEQCQARLKQIREEEKARREYAGGHGRAEKRRGQIEGIRFQVNTRIPEFESEPGSLRCGQGILRYGTRDMPVPVSNR